MAYYLYNGVKIPELPELKYPYVVLSGQNEFYHLFISSKPLSLRVIENALWFYEIPAETTYGRFHTDRYDETKFESWEFHGWKTTREESMVNNFVTPVVWANYDIYAGDTLYLPASCPVDPETGEVIYIYDTNYISASTNIKFDLVSWSTWYILGNVGCKLTAFNSPPTQDGPQDNTARIQFIVTGDEAFTFSSANKAVYFKNEDFASKTREQFVSATCTHFTYGDGNVLAEMKDGEFIFNITVANGLTTGNVSFKNNSVFTSKANAVAWFKEQYANGTPVTVTCYIKEAE